jgi:hypothetical protein
MHRKEFQALRERLRACIARSTCGQASTSPRGMFHIQHVNTYRSRLKDWMCRFKGGLDQAPRGWCRLLERFGDRLTPQTVLNLAVG